MDPLGVSTPSKAAHDVIRWWLTTGRAANRGLTGEEGMLATASSFCSLYFGNWVYKQWFLLQWHILLKTAYHRITSLWWSNCTDDSQSPRHTFLISVYLPPSWVLLGKKTSSIHREWMKPSGRHDTNWTFSSSQKQCCILGNIKKRWKYVFKTSKP